MSVFEPFKFAYLHSLRSANFATINLLVNASDADHPFDFLRDNRAATYWKLNTASADQIRWDRGAGFADLPDLTRVIVPAGNNLNGQLRILSDTDGAFPSPTTNLVISSISDDSLQIDLDFTTPITERHVSFAFDGTTPAFEIPQLIYTATFEPTTGFDSESMVDEFVANDRAFTQPSGAEARLSLGPHQRRFRVEYHRLSGADLGAMELFIATVGTSEPFWVDPPIFAASAVLDQDLSAVTTGTINVTDGGDMPTSTTDFTIGGERITGAHLSGTTFTLTSRGEAGTTAVTHETGKRIVHHPNTGAEHHQARWMKFERMPTSRVVSRSMAAGKTKFFSLELIDHVD